MLSATILKRRIGLLGLLPLAFLTSCAAGPDRPPEFRLQPVETPAPPAGNSDAEVAGFIAAYDRALTEANGRICWTRVYHRYSACPRPQ